MISSVYSYYLSNYGNKINAKYDTHKKSDIKNLYNRMLKINSQTPAYKVDFSEDAQKYAIDLKETARNLTHIANDLSDQNSDDIIFKKVAESSSSDAVDVKYIGDSTNPDINSFDIEVKQIAMSQINTGNFHQPSSKYIQPGDYSFDLNISDVTYEFEFSVHLDDTTLDIQEKLKRLVNRSNLGLKAGIQTDSLGNTALTIESESTGITGTRPTIFTITDDTENSSESDDNGTDESIWKNPTNTVSILGLNRTVQYPSNAVFSVDGDEANSYSNTFTINHEYEITLKEPSEETVNIKLKEDSESISYSINELISGYNNLVSVASNEDHDKFEGNLKLRREFNNIAHAYSAFSNNMFQVTDNGAIQINDDMLRSATDNGTISEVFTSLGQFKNVILQKAENISINPMDYVNNKIVAYKNPHRFIMDPYNTSIYSGMMFSGYI